MIRNQLMATAVLGIWIGINLFMWFGAGTSFSTVNRVLQAPNPQFAKITQNLSASDTRELMRHLASEINRTLFKAYNWTQVVLGIALLFLVMRQTPRDTTALALSGMMLVLVLTLTLVVTPQMVMLGRSLDFALRDPLSPEMARFHTLHGAYTGLDGVKLLAGLTLLVRWMVRG